MENKINVAEILRNCPQGMELNCTICNGVKFIELDRNPNFPIVVRANNGYEFSLTKYGQVHNIDDARCVIYPKGKTTWEEFVLPCEFKDGDIIFTHANCLKVGLGNTWISIYQENRNGGVATYVDYAEDGSDCYSNIDGDKPLLCMEKDILRQRLATEEEKAKLFDAIKANGYKWDEETKTLEKLVPAKFDINSMIPFESRVLVRENKKDVWQPAFYGFFNQHNKRFYTTSTTWRMCIPYNEDTKHLTGTTNDCDNFYKTWEELW